MSDSSPTIPVPSAEIAASYERRLERLRAAQRRQRAHEWKFGSIMHPGEDSPTLPPKGWEAP